MIVESFKTDEFTDFVGRIHRVVTVATLKKNEYDEGYIISLGFAVCNPKDEYKRKLAETIARGRARKEVDYIEIYCPPAVIDLASVARNFMKFIQSNPEYVIHGYDKSKERFNKITKDLSPAFLAQAKKVYICNGDDLVAVQGYADAINYSQKLAADN